MGEKGRRSDTSLLISILVLVEVKGEQKATVRMLEKERESVIGQNWAYEAQSNSFSGKWTPGVPDLMLCATEGTGVKPDAAVR